MVDIASEKSAAARQIYAVDDNEEMCRSLDALLSAAGYFLRYYTSPVQFLREQAQLAPGVLLVDLRMPEMDGLELLSGITSELDRYRVVMLTGHGEIASAVRSMKMGAADFLQKPFRETELLGIIERELAMLHEAPSEPSEPGLLLANLSCRERDVVERLARGLANKAIAKELGISVRTVEMHRSRAMQRLGCRNLAELLRLVFRTVV